MVMTQQQMVQQGKVSFGEALFSGTRQKVLGLLFGQPERSFFMNELIQLANSGSGSVQREVERLSSSGLLAVTQQGRQKSYQANHSSPIYAELCALIKKTIGPAQQLKSLFENTGEDVQLAILYGSVAKQTDRASSDIDLLIVSDTLTLEDLFNLLAPLENDLGRPVSPTLYTVAEFRDRKRAGNPFLARLLASDHIVLKGGVDGPTTTG